MLLPRTDRHIKVICEYMDTIRAPENIVSIPLQA